MKSVSFLKILAFVLMIASPSIYAADNLSHKESQKAEPSEVYETFRSTIFEAKNNETLTKQIAKDLLDETYETDDVFLFACAIDDRKLIEILVEQEVAFPFFNYGLLAAATEKHKSLVDYLISLEGLEKHFDQWNQLAHELVKNGYLDSLKKLAKYKGFLEGINDKRPISGHTPLTMAVLENKPDATALLIQLGANRNTMDADGCTPLIKAAGTNKIDVIRALLSEGPTEIELSSSEGLDFVLVDFISPTLNSSALMVAAGVGELDAVKELLLLGACPTLLNSYNWDALSFAAAHGRLSTILELYDWGCHSVCSALPIAAQCNQIDAFSVLTLLGGSIPAYYNFGMVINANIWNLWQSCLGAANPCLLVGALIDDALARENKPLLCIIFNRKLIQGETFLHCIVRYGHNGALKFLLSNDFNLAIHKNLDASNHCDCTPLSLAISNKNVEGALILLEAGANPLAGKFNRKTFSMWCRNPEFKKRVVKSNTGEGEALYGPSLHHTLLQTVYLGEVSPRVWSYGQSMDEQFSHVPQDILLIIKRIMLRLFEEGK